MRHQEECHCNKLRSWRSRRKKENVKRSSRFPAGPSKFTSVRVHREIRIQGEYKHMGAGLS